MITIHFSLAWSGKSSLCIPKLPPVGNSAGEETINRSCLVLLFGLLASLCDDVYRRPMAMAWAVCGAWIG
jgi:hypothetical protein